MFICIYIYIYIYYIYYFIYNIYIDSILYTCTNNMFFKEVSENLGATRSKQHLCKYGRIKTQEQEELLHGEK